MQQQHRQQRQEAIDKAPVKASSQKGSASFGGSRAPRSRNRGIGGGSAVVGTLGLSGGGGVIQDNSQPADED
jgi:hypothetical protein